MNINKYFFYFYFYSFFIFIQFNYVSKSYLTDEEEVVGAEGAEGRDGEEVGVDPNWDTQLAVVKTPAEL